MRSIFFSFISILFAICNLTSDAYARSGNWRQIAAVNGIGSTVCLANGSHSACFALRCGMGRGLEFGYFFTGARFESGGKLNLFVDGVYVDTLQLNVIDPSSELVAAYDVRRHENILNHLKSGNKLSVQLDQTLVFNLRGSADQIDRTMRECRNEIDLRSAEVDFPTDAIAISPTVSVSRFHDTNIPGNDIRSGLTDEVLSGISLERCENHCVMTSRCKAYSYIAERRMCFLKGQFGYKESAGGSLTGVVHRVSDRSSSQVARQDRPRPIGSLTWRRGDSAESFVARIRQAAIRLGDVCHKEKQHVSSLQENIEIQVSQKSVRAGETIDVIWHGNSLSEHIPAYLIVSSKSPVRFKGTGFYALMPNAIGPFGIETNSRETRAVVALFGKDALRRGTIPIETIFSGEVEITASVVGYVRRCQEVEGSKIFATKVEVVPSANPEIVVREQFEDRARNDYFLSPNGNRVLATNEAKDAFRILTPDLETVVLELDGVNPRFSPTGRFITVERDDLIQIYDAIDGSKLFQFYGYDIAWDNYDSFIYFSGPTGYGSATVRNTLSRDLPPFGGNVYGCHACSGLDSAKIKIDLENDVFIERVDGGMYLKLSHIYTNSNQRISSNQAALSRPLNALRNVGSVVNSKGWELRGPQFFTVLCPNCSTIERRKILSVENWDRRLVIPEKMPFARIGRVAISGGEVDNLQKTTWRGETAPATAKIYSPDFWDQISQLGVNTLKYKKPDYHKSIYEDKNFSGADEIKDETRIFGRYITDRILIDVPETTGMFIESNYLCKPSYNEDEPETEIFKQLHQANKFSLPGRILWVVHRECDDGSGAFQYPTFAIFDSERPGKLNVPDIKRPGNWGTGCASISFCQHTVALVENGPLVFYSSHARALALFDLHTYKTIFKLYDLPGGSALQEVRLTGDQKHIVQLNSDGAFFVHRLSDSKQVLEGRYVDDEIIFWAADFRFDATPEGAHFVNLKFNGQLGQYTFQQFSSRLKIAGLAKKIFSGDYSPRFQGISVPPKISGKFERHLESKIVGTFTPEGRGDLKSIHVYQDGVLTDEVPVSRSHEQIAVDVDRIPGTRWANVVAVDRAGYASRPIGRDLGPDNRKRVTTHLLAIGIDQYRTGLEDLNFAKTDALNFSESLASISGSHINLTEPAILVDKKASKKAILNAAERMISGIDSGDTAVVFFAGHGLKGEDGRFYIGTSATKVDDVMNSALAWDELAAVLAKSKGRIVVFLDACHSGAAGTSAFATNDDAVNGILKNIPTNLTVMSASKGRQFSGESNTINGGYFTKALATVISANRSTYDRNHNGAIEVSELYRGVKGLVSKWQNGLQTPWLARNQMIGDYALF